MKTVVALIDGEHYPPVIKDALAQLAEKNDWNFSAGLLLGGTEKIKSQKDLEQIGIPVLPLSDFSGDLMEKINRFKPQIVVDLSDEPVIGYHERFEIAATVLKAGCRYQGADFIFDPPQFNEVISGKPTITIFGTGKRIGKTAISSAVSKTLKHMKFDPVVVAMGRGGPAQPELLDRNEITLNPETLLQFSKEGRHAASDHFENALMSGVTTVGCRRCGGGLAGQTFVSNVLEGAKLANTLPNDFVVFDGSGAAIPPISTDVKILVLSANQPAEYFEHYMGPYRIQLADIAIITMAEEPLASPEKVTQVRSILKRLNPHIEIITTRFRPGLIEEGVDLSGKNVFYATTAPEFMQQSLGEYLETTYGARVCKISSHLSNRPKLRNDLEQGFGEYEIDAVLVELKAAAIDVVVESAIGRGVPVHFVNNIPIIDENRVFYDELAAIIARKLEKK